MISHYRTIVLSDLHLGAASSKAKEVTHFLKHHRCETLILNGDIIDGWQLRRGAKWKKQHSRFFRHVLKLALNRKCRVIYIRGNHDDFLEEIMPFEFANFSIRHYYIHQGINDRYFVTHGDVFDPVTGHFKWMAKLGDVGYTFLLWLNRHFNNFREKKGLPYYSISSAIKAKVKGAVNFISSFEIELASMARSRNCKGVICGHIHQPADKTLYGIHYLNSGDWVETLSALVETHEGEWKIIYYHDWVKQTTEHLIQSILPTGVTTEKND